MLQAGVFSFCEEIMIFRLWYKLETAFSLPKLIMLMLLVLTMEFPNIVMFFGYVAHFSFLEDQQQELPIHSRTIKKILYLGNVMTTHFFWDLDLFCKATSTYM
ncbi:uncharacterized protein [Coffea arabica]|uniref:Uncharacterized protein n=1 Tax=Coffea arabica TaxID=13443 RepID=A0ABM4VKB9_COFAR